MFDWNHLPVAGGILDQDPDWLNSARQIASIIQETEEREKKKKERSDRWRKEQGLSPRQD